MIDIKIDGLPPSVNHAYFNLPRGGRTLSAKGKKYKTETSTKIVRDYATSIRGLSKDRSYGLIVVFSFTDLYNKGWPDKTPNRYKKIDVSNRLKLLEDAVVDALGIDDSQFVFITLRKVPGEKEATRILVWDYDSEEMPLVGTWQV